MINAKRSPEAPVSLAYGRYNGADVGDTLHRDFLGKCYLCEQAVDRRQLAVDHRQPKALFAHLECAWSNLFPTCRDCNERRPKTYPAGGLLDPVRDDVEGRLFQTMHAGSSGEEVPYFAARDRLDMCAVSSAQELDELHNANARSSKTADPRARIKAADLRDAISRRIDEVLTMRLDLERQGKVSGPVLRACEDGLRAAFSRRAPFTALLRGRLGDGLERLFD